MSGPRESESRGQGFGSKAPVSSTILEPLTLASTLPSDALRAELAILKSVRRGLRKMSGTLVWDWHTLAYCHPELALALRTAEYQLRPYRVLQ